MYFYNDNKLRLVQIVGKYSKSGKTENFILKLS